MTIGDGINDAPALSGANAAVTLVSGTDLGCEVAAAPVCRDLNTFQRSPAGELPTRHEFVV